MERPGHALQSRGRAARHRQLTTTAIAGARAKQRRAISRARVRRWEGENGERDERERELSRLGVDRDHVWRTWGREAKGETSREREKAEEENRPSKYEGGKLDFCIGI